MVIKLTTGTAIKEANIATPPIVGAYAAFIFKIIAPPTEKENPVIIPAQAPAFVVPFQYKPYRKGAKKEPATVPQKRHQCQNSTWYCSNNI